MKEENKPLVSICCICYNHEHYIRQCLDGFLLQQTNFPFEVLINDDASTDSSADIIREYEIKYPQIIKPIFQIENQYSKGLRPFFSLIEKVNTKYIAFCEGDDYWTNPLKLQKQIDFLESNYDYGLVHTDVDYRFSNSNKVIKKINKKNYNFCLLDSNKNLFNDIYIGNYSLRTLSVVVNTQLVQTILKTNPDLFDQRFKMGDTTLWLELSRVTKFKYFQESTGVYNILEESASHSKSFKNIISFYKSMFFLAKHYKIKYHISENLYENLLKIFFKQLIDNAFIANDIEYSNMSIKLLPKSYKIHTVERLFINCIKYPVFRPLGFVLFKIDKLFYKINKIGQFYILKLYQS